MTFLSRSKIPGKVEFDAITSGDGNCLYRSASLILVGNVQGGIQIFFEP